MNDDKGNVIEFIVDQDSWMRIRNIPAHSSKNMYLIDKEVHLASNISKASPYRKIQFKEKRAESKNEINVFVRKEMENILFFEQSVKRT